MSFRQHLADALLINKKRAPIYKHQSNGRSANLSRTIITLEYLALPIATYFDRQAKTFNKQNILIIKNDFIAMNVPEQTRAPLYQNPLKPALLKDIKHENKQLVRNLQTRTASKDDLNDFYQLSKTHLTTLKQYEQNNHIHLSMATHLLESYLFICKNSMLYAEQSNNKTLKLSNQLLKLHLRLLNHSLIIDKQANACHQMGVGIIYNDLPIYEDL